MNPNGDTSLAAGLAKRLLLLVIFAFLGLGVFYNSSKFHVPWYGGQDFANYAKMVERPFDHAAGSPFAYRVVTPLIAHLALKSGVYYHSPGPFGDAFTDYEGETFEPRTLSALIFTNYLLLVAAAVVLSEVIGLALRGGERGAVALAQVVAPAFLFLSLSTNVHALAGLTVGGSLLFVCLMLLLLRLEWFWAFAAAALLSVLQRELIPMMFLVYILAARAPARPGRYLAACVAAAALFFFVKLVALPIPGNEHQTDPGAVLGALAGFRPDAEFLRQAVLSNNILFAALLLALYLGLGLRGLARLAPFAAVALFLAVIGVGAGIGNNVGRILNLASPMLILGMVEALNLRLRLGRPPAGE